MRIALFQPVDTVVTGLDALRAAAAAANWPLTVCQNPDQIQQMAPDLVIAADAQSGKCTGHPWLGWLRTDPALLRSDRRRLECLLSHDGFLVDTNPQRQFIIDTLAPTGRPAHVLAADDLSDQNLALLAAQVRSAAGFTPQTISPTVDYIVRVGGRSIDFVRRCLDSLGNQTAPGVGVILVRYAPVPGLEAEIQRQQSRLRRVHLVDVASPTTRSTCLWAGLAAVLADLFGVLDDDDALHPNHVASLAPLALGGHVAVAGSVQVWEGADQAKQSGTGEPPSRSLHGLPPPLPQSFLRWQFLVHSSAFLASSALLEQVGPDPELNVTEDTWLLRRLVRQAGLRASWRVTTDFYWRRDRTSNTAFSAEGRTEAMSRIADRERLDPIIASIRQGQDDSDLPEGPAWGQPAAGVHLPRLHRPADFWSLPTGRPLYIYGSGYGGRVVLGEISKMPHLPVTALLDSFQVGSAFGLPMQRPDQLEADQFKQGVFIIASEHVAAIAEILRTFGADTVYDATPFIGQYTNLRRG